MRAITSYRPPRLHLAIGAAVLAVLLVVAGIAIYLNAHKPGVHARLALAKGRDYVRVNEPVTVRFDEPVDLSRVQPVVEPAANVTVTHTSTSLVVTPAKGWEPAKEYTLRLVSVPDAKHEAKLTNWHSRFATQPKVGVTGFTADGRPLDPAKGTLNPRAKLAIQFSSPMKPSSVSVLKNGQPVPAEKLTWAADQKSVQVPTDGLLPYTALKLEVAPVATNLAGDPLTDTASANLTGIDLLPVNTTSGIDGNFKPVSPSMVVIENSGDSRPQAGLQAADIVYEYLSEYSITRMTAIYFNKPPGLVGPVRSCRMINNYLGYAFDGYTLCSGASVGTLHYIFNDPHLLPGSINDFDRGSHFYRVGFRAAPHNLYTDGDRAVTLRQQWSLPAPNYALDPPHDDVDMGQPADAPSIPAHSNGWSYDGGTRQYLKYDHGAAFMDDLAKGQVRAKNVVIMHVPFHDAGWVEDDNGGAHSVWYDMLGSGPAEIYSDGKLVHATWHMGDPATPYYSNTQAPWFTDEAGKVIELNSGLTWIHVLGHGQTG